ncbi:MAG: hypothetical protein HY830_26600, partial [Actinobacteria bacterium]|nr:hypothetical protein [Actinomycetota bacterium]
DLAPAAAAPVAEPAPVVEAAPVVEVKDAAPAPTADLSASGAEFPEVIAAVEDETYDDLEPLTAGEYAEDPLGGYDVTADSSTAKTR